MTLFILQNTPVTFLEVSLLSSYQLLSVGKASAGSGVVMGHWSWHLMVGPVRKQPSRAHWAHLSLSLTLHAGWSPPQLRGQCCAFHFGSLVLPFTTLLAETGLWALRYFWLISLTDRSVFTQRVPFIYKCFFVDLTSCFALKRIKLHRWSRFFFSFFLLKQFENICLHTRMCFLCPCKWAVTTLVCGHVFFIVPGTVRLFSGWHLQEEWVFLLRVTGSAPGQSTGFRQGEVLLAQVWASEAPCSPAGLWFERLGRASPAWCQWETSWCRGTALVEEEDWVWRAAQ